MTETQKFVSHGHLRSAEPPTSRAPTVGIIGGIGPESTVVYYRSIVALYQRRNPDGASPRILLNSIDLKAMLALVTAHQFDALTEFLLAEIRKLAAAGADFAVVAANTPHLVFGALAERASIPLISIVDVTRDAVRQRGISRVGLFGTRYTMQSRLYHDVFEPVGIDVIVPSPAEQEYVHDKYFSELGNGIVRDETRAELLAIVDRMRERDRIEGIILGGTELSLIMGEGTRAAVPVLDTTALHAQAIVERLLPP